jgi:hypothetical protein
MSAYDLGPEAKVDGARKTEKERRKCRESNASPC